MSEEAPSSPVYKNSFKGLPYLTITTRLGTVPELCPAITLISTRNLDHVYYFTLIASQTSIDLVRNQTQFVSLVASSFKKHHGNITALSRDRASQPSLHFFSGKAE